MTLAATTGFGLESVLKNEILLSGREILHVEPGFVIFSGTEEDLYYFNASLRTADRVFMVLKVFRAVSFDELFDQVRSYPFEEIMPERARVDVKANSFKSTLYSTQNIQRITKKAIASRFSSIYGISTMEESGHSYPITVKFHNDQVTMLLDTTGEPLFKRGYRIQGRVAPIRENMAAALVLLSRYFGKGVFVDPMCGSGTIAIEAAMIARDMAPGLHRKFLFESWRKYDHSTQREELLSKIKKDIDFPIFASDRSDDAIFLAGRNAEQAGVFQDIIFKHQDLEQLNLTETGGTLVTNAPYGARMGSEEELRELGATLVSKVLSLETYRLGLLLGDADFAKKHKRRPQKIRRLNNGQLRTFYYQYEPIKRW